MNSNGTTSSTDISSATANSSLPTGTALCGGMPTACSSTYPSSSPHQHLLHPNHSNNNLTSMKDWFTYVYKIDSIKDIIQQHEQQQNFIQSQIFQFKNHYLSQTKQNSNWRLIFYPNGAGGDCKNFLSIFLKYLSDEPVKIQMMFSIVNNQNEDVYVKYTVNKFNKSNDWGFKQLIHKNAILFQQEKFLKTGSLFVRVKMRLDEHKNEFVKKLNDNLHYCRILSENFSQYYYNTDVTSDTGDDQAVAVQQQQQQQPVCSTMTTTATTTTPLSSLSQQSSYYDILLIVKNTDQCTVNDEVTQAEQSQPAPAPPQGTIVNKRRKSHDSFNCPPNKRQCSDTTHNSITTLYTSTDQDTSCCSNNEDPQSTTTTSIPILANKFLFNSLLAKPNTLIQLSSSTQPSSCCTSTSISSSSSSTTSSSPHYSSSHPQHNNNHHHYHHHQQQHHDALINSMITTFSQATTSTTMSTTTSTHPSSINDESTANSCNCSSCCNGSSANTSTMYTCRSGTSQTTDDSILSQCRHIEHHNTSPNSSANNTHCKISVTSAVPQAPTQKPSEIYEFRAHKCILAARSPVFKAMFNYNLKENLTNKVIIEDCKPDVVKAMLKYIYTAYLPDDIEHIAIDLFIAAEKYYIESLKFKVREYLVENLCYNNALQIYILSELYNDSMLRKQSLKFICDNIDKVTQNSDWDEYLQMYPQFFTNAFIRLCKKDF